MNLVYIEFTVAILPELTEVDVQIKESDLKNDVYRAPGALVAMQDERSQHKAN
ncbi:hypothetical protein EDC94DRAFT_658857 [Helicostylum pulchrum]|nr:hypothetical protein EDC94DRAFT_658857 [Helicostylum pulchrum]